LIDFLDVWTVAQESVGTTIGRIGTAELPDTALHPRIAAPRSVGTTIARMTRKTAG